MKNIKMRIFNITALNVTKEAKFITELLDLRLKESLSKDRLLALQQDDLNSEYDLMLYHEKTSLGYKGILTRLSPVSEGRILSESMLDKKSITLEELSRSESLTGYSAKNSWYFYISDKYLVTNLRLGSTILGIQTYFNWLLANERKKISYEFKDVINKKHKELRMRDIKSIVFKNFTLNSDVSNNSKENKETSTIKRTLPPEVLDLIKEAIGVDTPDFNKLTEEQLITAEIFLKFAKPTKKNSEMAVQALQNIITPMADDDLMSIYAKSGRIKGNDLRETRVYEYEPTDRGGINQENLWQAMEKYINDMG